MEKRRAFKASKKTFYLHKDVLEGIDALVGAGHAASQNALIEELVRRRFSQLRRERQEQKLRAAYAGAMQNAAYRSDQERIEHDFAAADRETWERDI